MLAYLGLFVWLFFSYMPRMGAVPYHCRNAADYEATIPIGNANTGELCSGGVSRNAAAGHTRGPCRRLQLCLGRTLKVGRQITI